MSLFDIVLIGPGFAILATAISYALLPIADQVGREWARWTAFALAAAGAILVVWLVSNGLALQEGRAPEGFGPYEF